MTCGIYMIQNKVNGKMYIGQAVDIEGERWIRHRSELRGGYHVNKHLQRSWNKYGEMNFEFSILLECEETQLNTYEQYYIFELMAYDSRVGYNKTYGGDSGRPTEEARKKLSEAKKGKTLSEEHRKRISEGSKGKTLCKEHREKLSEAHKGKNNPNSKLVVQINPSTSEIINTYFGTREAARQTGFCQTSISKCCRGEQKMHKGFRWMYLSDYEKLKEEN